MIIHFFGGGGGCVELNLSGKMITNEKFYKHFRKINWYNVLKISFKQRRMQIKLNFNVIEDKPMPHMFWRVSYTEVKPVCCTFRVVYMNFNLILQLPFNHLVLLPLRTFFKNFVCAQFSFALRNVYQLRTVLVLHWRTCFCTSSLASCWYFNISRYDE